MEKSREIAGPRPPIERRHVIATLQASLIALGYDVGPAGADGRMGADTARALREAAGPCRRPLEPDGSGEAMIRAYERGVAFGRRGHEAYAKGVEDQDERDRECVAVALGMEFAPGAPPPWWEIMRQIARERSSLAHYRAYAGASGGA